MDTHRGRDAVIYTILYIVKRTFVAVDEWLFYIALMYLYQRKYPLWITLAAAVYGAIATITHYKNLEIIERRLGICGWFLWLPRVTAVALPPSVSLTPVPLVGPQRLPLD